MTYYSIGSHKLHLMSQVRIMKQGELNLPKNYSDQQSKLFGDYLGQAKKQRVEDLDEIFRSRGSGYDPSNIMFLGGAGAPMPSQGYGRALMGMPPPPTSGNYFSPVPNQAYGPSSGLGSAPGMPGPRRGALNISYTGSDGTTYNLGASYDVANRGNVVDGLMKYATALVKADAGGKSYGKGGKN